MNRMLVAILFSLALHGALLLWRFGWQTNASRVDVPLRIMTVHLADAPPLPPAMAAPAPKLQPGKPKRIVVPKAVAASPPQAVMPARPKASVAPTPGSDQPATSENDLAGPQAAARQEETMLQASTAPEAAPQPAHPLYLENQPPHYPPLARRQRYEGTTELEVLVSTDGTADELRLRNSSGHPVLDRAALAAVRQWKFTPGRLGAEPVAMWVTVPIRFELQ